MTRRMVHEMNSSQSGRCILCIDNVNVAGYHKRQTSRDDRHQPADGEQSMRAKKPLLLAIVALAATAGVVLFYYLNVSADTPRSQLLAIQASIPTQAGKNAFLEQSGNLSRAVDPHLVDLDSQIITCQPDVDSLLSPARSYGNSCVAPGAALRTIKGLSMGGQCCGVMLDTKEYHENLAKLQAYKVMANVPLDPMHTLVAVAKMWIDYDKQTTLTASEQTIYDEAYALSEEKPCCCTCWHYFVNEGIAKKMVKDGASPKQIAAYWDASAICGV
jgi:hypothetical protein